MLKAHVYLIYFQRVANTKEQKERFLLLRFNLVKMIWKMAMIVTIVLIEKLAVIKDYP